MIEINDKPSLKISHLAAYVLSCDLCAFGASSSAVSFSRLINSIIINFADVSETVRNTTDKISEEELIRLFDRLGQVLTKSMLSNFRATSVHDIEKYRYPNDSVNIRISLTDGAIKKLTDFYDDVYKTLHKIYCKGEKFSPPAFISALVEEYSRLPMFRRESIFYSDTIRILSDAIRSNNDGETCYLTIDTKKRKNIKVYPIDILLDEWSTYNYLVGIGIFDSKLGEMPISMRISNILDIRVSFSERIVVLHNQPMIDELYKHIETRGVMFMGSPYTQGEEIKIRLTSQGFDTYNNVVFLRPRYTKDTMLDNNDHIMTFTCTRFQIKNYFRKFGGDAEILEPLSLREEFAEFYKMAKDVYDNKSSIT